jgi:hypothetical protein
MPDRAAEAAGPWLPRYRSSQDRLLDSAPDMGPLAAVERFLERLFERQSARLFRTAIRPVVVLRRLERTMEEGRLREGSRTVVPHAFVVHLSGADQAALQAGAPGLAATLAEAALTFARRHGYTLLDRPRITLRADRHVEPGDVWVEALGTASAQPTGPDSAEDESRVAAAGDLDAAPDRPIDRTAVFVVPEIGGPRATIREIRPDRSSRAVRFEGRPLTIGRAADNRLVLRDGRASRHHARIDARRGSLVLSDLGSTNGSFVNDRRVVEVALGEGDRIRLGMTTLVVEAIEEPAGSVAGREPMPDDAQPS